jgi:hypothetical protein
MNEGSTRLDDDGDLIVVAVALIRGRRECPPAPREAAETKMGAEMKKLLLTGIAALFLATGAAHAGQTADELERDCAITYMGHRPENKADYERCLKRIAKPKSQWPSPNFVGDWRRDRLYMYFDEKNYEEVSHAYGGTDGDDIGRPGVIIPLGPAREAWCPL